VTTTAPDLAYLTLRTVDTAKRFPQELPTDAMGRKRGEATACNGCGSALREVVITTGGPYANAEVWELYPLAIDGWQCSGCEKVSFPILLAWEEVHALANGGVRDAQRGAFDDAELAFRRVIASWPTYSPVRINFGALCLDRIASERRGANRPHVVQRYIGEAEHQLRKALVGEPPPAAPAYFMLGNLLWSLGRTADAKPLLAKFVAMPDAAPPMRAHAEGLLRKA
jgi:hypothetical protein